MPPPVASRSIVFIQPQAKYPAAGYKPSQHVTLSHNMSVALNAGTRVTCVGLVRAGGSVVIIRPEDGGRSTSNINFTCRALMMMNLTHVTFSVAFSDCNPGICFSIPGSGIEKFVIPGSRFKIGLQNGRYFGIHN